MKCYAMITELSNRARFVKFGVSENPKFRVMNVQCGCPLRIETMLEMDCGTDYHARVIESALHLEHSDDHASGEWFRFSEGTKALARSREAMLLMGQRVIGHCWVVEHAISPGDKPRMYRGKTAKVVRGYAPVIGDREISAVTVIHRRKSLKTAA